MNTSVQQLETVSEEGSSWVEMRSTKTTIPFVKNNEFDYSWLLVWLNKDLEKYTWIIFIPLVIIIVTAVSNGANITDGLDGLSNRHKCYYWNHTCHFCISFWKPSICRLFKYSFYS